MLLLCKCAPSIDDVVRSMNENLRESGSVAGISIPNIFIISSVKSCESAEIF